MTRFYRQSEPFFFIGALGPLRPEASWSVVKVEVAVLGSRS